MDSALQGQDFSIQRDNQDIIIIILKGEVICLPLFILNTKKH